MYKIILKMWYAKTLGTYWRWEFNPILPRREWHLFIRASWRFTATWSRPIASSTVASCSKSPTLDSYRWETRKSTWRTTTQVGEVRRHKRVQLHLNKNQLICYCFRFREAVDCSGDVESSRQQPQVGGDGHSESGRVLLCNNSSWNRHAERTLLARRWHSHGSER